MSGRRASRGQDLTVGYLPLSCDLLNVRDLDLVGQARACCSRLVVGVLSDDLVLRLHGRRPVVPCGERLQLAAHLRGVAEAVRHDDEAAELAGDVLVFAVAGEPVVTTARAPWLLVPRRETTSPVLREALQPSRREEVA